MTGPSNQNLLSNVWTLVTPRIVPKFTLAFAVRACWTRPRSMCVAARIESERGGEPPSKSGRLRRRGTTRSRASVPCRWRVLTHGHRSVYGDRQQLTGGHLGPDAIAHPHGELVDRWE